MSWFDISLVASYASLILLFIYVYCFYEYVLKFWVRRITYSIEEMDTSFEHNYFTVDVVLIVKNEESVIKKRLNNLFAQKFHSPVNIYVVSDGSSDATNRILSEFKNINIFINNESRGKSYCQNLVLRHLKSQIVIYTDAETDFNENFVSEICKSYKNNSIGCVVANLDFCDADSGYVKYHNKYWKYETQLRKLESNLGCLMVSSGAAVSLRRELVPKIPEFIGDDCFFPLYVYDKGYKCVFSEDSIAYDCSHDTAQKVFKSRVRMALRNLAGTLYFPNIVYGRKSYRDAIVIWSHKILRWALPPVFFVIALISMINFALTFTFSAFLISLPFWMIIGFSLSAIIFPNSKIFQATFSFILVSVAYSYGFILYITKRKQFTYEQ